MLGRQAVRYAPRPGSLPHLPSRRCAAPAPYGLGAPLPRDYPLTSAFGGASPFASLTGQGVIPRAGNRLQRLPVCCATVSGLCPLAYARPLDAVARPRAVGGGASPPNHKKKPDPKIGCADRVLSLCSRHFFVSGFFFFVIWLPQLPLLPIAVFGISEAISKQPMLWVAYKSRRGEDVKQLFTCVLDFSSPSIMTLVLSKCKLRGVSDGAWMGEQQAMNWGWHRRSPRWLSAKS